MPPDPSPAQTQEQRQELRALPTKRCIWTDLEGLRNPYGVIHTKSDELEPGVYAIVGPIADHTAEPEFQDTVGLACIEANYKSGALTEPKYSELKARNRSALLDHIERLEAALREAMFQLDIVRPRDGYDRAWRCEKAVTAARLALKEQQHD